jgi:hypothetical protein
MEYADALNGGSLSQIKHTREHQDGVRKLWRILLWIF